jgi:hypothetical protein
MKVYISGPISGLSDLNRSAFERAEKKLTEQGHTAVNPLKASPVRDNWEWKDYMRNDILELLGCDSVYALTGWEQSRGAKIEIELARTLGMGVVEE